MFCYLEQGEKPFWFEWYKNGRPLQLNSLLTIDTNDDVSVLAIDSVDINDGGNYSCLARNKHNIHSQYTLLIVKGLKKNYFFFFLVELVLLDNGNLF